MKLGWSLATRYYVLTIVLILLVLLAWASRELFSPLVIAGLFAYVLNPIANLLSDRTRLGHRFAVNLVYFVSIGLLIALPAVLIPILSSDIETLSQDLLADSVSTSILLTAAACCGWLCHQPSELFCRNQSSR